MDPCDDHADDLKRLRTLRELKPDVFNAFVEFDRKAFEDGALSVKTKELIAVAMALRAGGSRAHCAVALQALQE